VGKEEREGMSGEEGLHDEERVGLAERRRQDEEKAKVNRERQIRQGVISEESKEEKSKAKAK
jgi:hypothetical protein